MWISEGNFEYKIENESFRIFPKGPDGKTRPVWVKRAFIYLRRQLLDETYTTIFFKYYLHQRNFYWSDSRKTKGSVSRDFVKKELARLLYKKDESKAQHLMVQIEGLL